MSEKSFSTLSKIQPHPIENVDDLTNILVNWQFADMSRDPFADMPGDMDVFAAFQTDYMNMQFQSSLMYITREELDAASSFCELRLVLFNGTLWLHPKSRRNLNDSLPVKPEWVNIFVQQLREISRMGFNLPNIDFLVTTPDRPLCQGPAFSYARRRVKKDSKLFLVPYPTWNKDKLSDLRHSVLKANEKRQWQPWTSKLDQLFWRGSTTGIRFSKDLRVKKDDTDDVNDQELLVWQNITRYRLMLLANKDNHHKNSSRFNVSFSGIYAETPKRLHKYLMPFVSKPGDNIADAAAFKYVLDVEGNSFSDRLRDLVGLENVLLKQEYPYIDFIGVGLQPWLHYVPIEQDLSDLGTMLDLVSSSGQSDLMKDWARCKADWTRFYLSIDLPTVYLYKLLQRYEKSLDFKVSTPPPSGIFLKQVYQEEYQQ